MLKASLELNKVLEEIANISETLGNANGPKECQINSDELIQAATKFLKCYELCIRIDESLGDIIRHQGTAEIEHSLERSETLMHEIVRVVKSFSEKERRLFVIHANPDFERSKGHLNEFLKKRPSERIWREENIQHAIIDLSNAVTAFRKSAAYAMLMATLSGVNSTGLRC